MDHVTLNTGAQMPMLGFGVYQVADGDECEQAVSAALEAGYRLIDTAAGYGNEEAVGRAIAASGIPRDELFVTTKLWIQDASEDAAKRAIETSLGKLGLDRLDLYLIHQPYGDVYGAWRAMTAAHRDGTLTSIGVSNFGPDRLVDLILHTDVVPAVNQVETHVFCQQKRAREVMATHGVQVESWGPFAEGKDGFFTDATLEAIGSVHGKTVAQVALRWLVQSGVVAIPKSVRPERMAENIDVFDFTLTDEEMATIAGLDTGASLFLDHHDPDVVERLCGLRIHD